MESKITVHKGYYNFNIEAVEEKYSAKYIGDFSIKTKYGNWSDQPVSIFYVENPDTERGHSHYFGLFLRYNDLNDLSNTTLLITNAESVTEGELTGVMADNGEIIVSCYRHDFKYSEDGTVFVDGYRDYIRSNSSNFIKINIINGQFIIKNPPESTTTD